jgi:hypothetical protein
MVTEIKEEQPWNEQFPMVVTLLGMVTEVREEQSVNPPLSMIVTLFGMITEVKEMQFINAFSPMTTAGCPPIVEGIVIAPPAPLYPVMVLSSSFTI